MENTEKIRKQFHSPGSELIIKFGGWLPGVVAVIVLIKAFGASFSTVVVISRIQSFEACNATFRLALSLVVTLVSIFILITIISLIII